MASIRAHLASQVCKLIVKRPLVRSPTIETIRKVFNANHPPVPKGCTARDESVGGVNGEWMTVENAPSAGTMLYLHGGAHVACSPRTHRPATSWFAKHGWRVFAPDYRLAPEHPFPAGLEDCVAAYRGLLSAGVDPKRLVIAGDSAGGNLTLAVALSLRSAGAPLPAALGLFSPVADFTWSGDSSTSNSDRCAMFAKNILPIGAKLYLGDHDPRDPLASPVFADYSGMPPMLLHVGEPEILRDDSIRVADRARAAGVETVLKVWPVVPHVWQLLHPFVPEGRASLTEMVRPMNGCALSRRITSVATPRSG